MASRDDYSSISLKEPTTKKLFTTIDDWLACKRINDGAEGLWRIHDKLYDVTRWMKLHPGGKYWLEVTRGTDITEAFECHHLTDTAEKMLGEFYIKEAKTPRNSQITFHDDGFFRTLKRKLRERNLLSDTRPPIKTKLVADGLAVLVFGTGLLATVHDFRWGILSGVFLNMLSVCAHNFFHMRDNWRMYYFNLSLMSLREWRISHALSHHLYPNTKLDLEISMFEPVLRFLPDENKKFRYVSWLLSPFVMLFMTHFQIMRRCLEVLLSIKMSFHREDFVGLSLLLFFYFFGGLNAWRTFVAWNIVIASGSFWFGLVGLTAAHHHPDIYHDGDFIGNNKDFGVFQLAAVRDRTDVNGNFFLTMILFGEHALHHIFPTIDHSKLPALSGVFEETCREFNIRYKPMKIKNLVGGMYQQLVRNYKNSKLMILD